MFVLACLLDAGQSVSDVLNGWRHGHGLQPTSRAMAKIYKIEKGMSSIGLKRDGFSKGVELDVKGLLPTWLYRLLLKYI